MIDERHLELIHGEIDGENSAEESRELHQALDSSTECRALYEDLRRVADLLQDAKPVEPPRQLRARIVDALVDALPARAAAAGTRPCRSGMAVHAHARIRRAFAMGLLVAFGAVSVQRWAGDADLDISQLAGTMTQHDRPSLHQRLV